MIPIYIATEDQLSETIVDRLVSETRGHLQVTVRMGRHGNTFLRKKLPELARVAPTYPVFLLTDLDNMECAPTLIDEWKNNIHFPPNLLLRVAVREVESWLLADRYGFSRFSGIPISKIPGNPEALADPKQTLLNLVDRYGRKRIKEEILPGPRSTAKIGLGYNSTLGTFAREHWNPTEAANHADSLSRAMAKLQIITQD